MSTLADLRTELQSRGFDYLSSTRCNAFLNAAYQNDICEQEEWPFLEATSTGTAPLTISDLRTIESVIDTTQSIKLIPLDRRNITDELDTSLTTVGTPEFYYTTTTTTVAVYPANTTDSLSVRYWKFPAALADADTPLIPTRFQSLVVDAAVARAYEDNDEWQMAQAASQAFQTRLQAMRDSLLSQQHDLPDDYVSTSWGSHTDASWAW